MQFGGPHSQNSEIHLNFKFSTNRKVRVQKSVIECVASTRHTIVNHRYRIVFYSASP